MLLPTSHPCPLLTHPPVPFHHKNRPHSKLKSSKQRPHDSPSDIVPAHIRAMADPTPVARVTRSMMARTATSVEEEEEEEDSGMASPTSTKEQEKAVAQRGGDDLELEHDDQLHDIPESPSAAGTTSVHTTRTGLRKARRKLSVVSENVLVDGIQDIHLDETLNVGGDKGSVLPCLVSAYAGKSQKGFAPYHSRKKNQDALIMAEEPHTSTLFFCVLDGHGEFGELVSGFFQRELARNLFAHDCFEQDPRRAFVEVLAALEHALLRDTNVDTDFSGTTMSAVLLRGDRMLVFNCGDSRVTVGVREEPPTSTAAAAAEGSSTSTPPQRPSSASSSSSSSSIPKPTPTKTSSATSFLSRRSLSLSSSSSASSIAATAPPLLIAIPLSLDHKPDVPPEKARILAAGGRVFAVHYDDGVDGPPRVWLGHMDVPGLAMSRSLGDAVAHSVGVSSEPEVFEYTLDSKKEVFLILATDGLWEFCSDGEVVTMVGRARDPQEAVEGLIKEANARWLREEQVVDDTTVCVAFLGDWKK